MDVEIFESGKKNLRIPKYPDTCERGPKLINLGKLSTVIATYLFSLNLVTYIISRNTVLQMSPPLFADSDEVSTVVISC